MTDFDAVFHEGDRVKYTGRLSYDLRGREGRVSEHASPGNVVVDFGVFGSRDVKPENLTKVAPASTYLNGLDNLDMTKGRFLTAWKNGPDFTLTGDNYFNTLSDADRFANDLAGDEPGATVVVLRVVSEHSSDVRVTSNRV